MSGSLRPRARADTCIELRRKRSEMTALLGKKQLFLEFDVFFSCLQVNSRL